MINKTHAKALRVLAENTENGIPLGDEWGIEAQALRNAAEYIDYLESLIKDWESMIHGNSAKARGES